MTQETYKIIMRLGKEYLVDFIREIENLPHVKGLSGDDLCELDILKFDDLYYRVKDKRL